MDSLKRKNYGIIQLLIFYLDSGWVLAKMPPPPGPPVGPPGRPEVGRSSLKTEVSFTTRL